MASPPPPHPPVRFYYFFFQVWQRCTDFLIDPFSHFHPAAYFFIKIIIDNIFFKKEKKSGSDLATLQESIWRNEGGGWLGWG